MGETVPGLDDPLWRDWLFWTVLVFATGSLLVGIAVADVPWWVRLSQWCSALFLGGVILGSARELVRGWREPRDTA